MKDELINHIRKQLQEHEEPYTEGAWERFSKTEVKKPAVLLWPFWTAAAIILIVGGFFMGYNFNKSSSEVVKNHNKNNEIIVSQENNKVELNSKQAIEFKQTNEQLKHHYIVSKKANKPKVSLKGFADENIHLVINKNVNTSEEKDNVLDNSDLIIEKNDPQKPVSFTDMANVVKDKKDEAKSIEDFLAQETKKIANDDKKLKPNNNKWIPELFVAPAIGNSDKLNINYGVSMNYAIDEKLTIASGIAYNHLNSSRGVNIAKPQEMLIKANATESSEKNLESIQASVRGITIPLDLKYNISKKLYSSIGVSAMAIINNTQSNNFVSYKLEHNNVMSAQSKGPEMIVMQKREVVNEKLNEVNQDKYIGFYNFSIGFKQKINNKNNIAIEPYISLPMKNVNKESLNFSNGGFKLKYNF